MCELNSHTNSVGVSVVLIGDGLLTGFDGCFSALHYTSCSRTEVDDMIRKFTNVLLTRTLGGCMASLIRRPCLTLLQVRLLLHKYSSYNDLSLQLFLVAQISVRLRFSQLLLPSLTSGCVICLPQCFMYYVCVNRTKLINVVIFSVMMYSVSQTPLPDFF